MPRHVYGPVPSRRLGRSLGVDLVPLKTCSLDCIYCQLGATARTTLQRAEYVPVDPVIEEVRARLAQGAAADHVTLGGSGEPTLHSGFGEVARRIKEFSRVPVALLTNGSLLSRPEVRAACGAIDVVIPSLDAADEEAFRLLNRPHPDLSLAQLVDGLEALREEFEGRIWLEVFLVQGLNTSDADVAKLGALIERIRPDRIDLNTAVRPPAEGFVRPAPPQRLAEIAAMLGPKAQVIADVEVLRQSHETAASAQMVLDVLQRRPCTVEDLATGLSIPPDSAAQFVSRLMAEGKLVESREADRLFYRAS